MAVIQVGKARLAPPGGFLDQGLEELVHFTRLAVVGMQGDIDVVLRRDAVSMFRQADRAQHCVLQVARGVFTASGGHLDAKW